MKLNKFTLLIAFIIFFLVFGKALFAKQAKYSSHHISQKINKILNEFGENLNVGILLNDAKTGKSIYKLNEDRYFTPASVQKLFTAWVALNYLGKSFTFQTQAFLDSMPISEGLSENNVYIKFSGDPTLTFSQLDHLIQSLVNAGVKKIQNVLVDDTIFDYETMSPGTTWDDKDYCFGSPISGIIINQNCVKASIVPAIEPNQTTILALSDQPQFMNFINNSVTVTDGCKCKLETKLINENTYSINGCIQISDPPKNIEMAIRDPHYNLKAMLEYLFHKYGIQWNKQIQFKSISPIQNSIKLIATEQSAPLQALITTMLKESDNTIGNALFKTVGYYHSKKQGAWKSGNEAFKDIVLKTLKISFPEKSFFDGAGASRYIYLTPQQVNLLLAKITFSEYASFFKLALPKSGIDGTLEERMKGKHIKGRVQAKTGTESGVTALAGYLRTKRNQQLIFSIFINGFVNSPYRYKALEDKICETLINYL